MEYGVALGAGAAAAAADHRAGAGRVVFRGLPGPRTCAASAPLRAAFRLAMAGPAARRRARRAAPPGTARQPGTGRVPGRRFREEAVVVGDDL